MVYEVLNHVTCYRCKDTGTFLFETEGFVHHPSLPRLHVFLCFDCLEDLVDTRVSFQTSLRQGRRRGIDEEDALMVESIVLRQQGVDQKLLRYDTGSLQSWLPGAMIMPSCAFCGSLRAFNIYHFEDDPFPLLTLCKTCIRQLVVANSSVTETAQLFGYVQFIRCPFRTERLHWGSMALVAFLAVDCPWAEAMQPLLFDS